MSSILKHLKLVMGIVVLGLVFAAFASLKGGGKVYAATYCSSPDEWVGMNVYVDIENSSGASIGYSSSFTFFVTAFVPTGSPAVPYLDETIVEPGGGAYPGTDAYPSSNPAYDSRTSATIQTAGGMHDCSGQPAYDFTDGTNGNLYLNCLGGATHGYPQTDSAGFAFTPVSVQDATAGTFTSGAVYFWPTAATDLNKQNFSVTWVYRENAPPPVNITIQATAIQGTASIPLANATFYVCNYGYVTSNGNGQISFTEASGTGICIRPAGGEPGYTSLGLNSGCYITSPSSYEEDVGEGCGSYSYYFDYYLPAQGHFDGASCTNVFGWAYDDPNNPMWVQIFVNGVPASNREPSDNSVRGDVLAALAGETPPQYPSYYPGFSFTDTYGSAYNLPNAMLNASGTINISVEAFANSSTPYGFFLNYDGPDGASSTSVNIAGCYSPPTISSAIPSCALRGYNVTDAVEPDWGGPYPSGWLTYSVDGSGYVYTAQATGGNNYVMSLDDPPGILYDQLVAHNVFIQAEGFNEEGQPTGGYNYFSTQTYPACYQPVCGTGTVSPNPIITNPSPSSTFQATVTITLQPNPGTNGPANPTSAAWAGGAYTNGSISQDWFTNPGGTNYGFNPPSSNYNSANPDSVNELVNSIQTPGQSGNGTLYWQFSDPTAGYLFNCQVPNGSIPVSNAPFYSATGDVEAGSAFGSSSCEDLNAAGTSNLIGTGMDGVIGYNQNTAPNYTGSGTELAVEALGQIYGFASQQVAGATPPTGASLSNTADNIPAAEDYGGGFQYASCPPTIDPTGSTVITPGAGGISLSGLDGKYVINGSVKINASTIGIGDDVQLYVNSGYIYIDGPIEYNTTGWNSPANIPSLTLATNGGNIYVDPSVTQLDGTYIAQPLETITGSQISYNNTTTTTGIIYDCSASTASGQFPTGTGNCNNTLTVNGAFIANQIKFQRAYGNVNGTTGIAPTPAEQFNYSPEEWLNSANTSPETYDSITALPPVL